MADDIGGFLRDHLRPMAGPYLFVGAGFSLRYGGLPSWRDLLSKFADDTGMPFDYYLSGAGSMPAAATRIAAEFHELWWRDPAWANSRSEWQDRATDIAMPLKIEISNWLNGATKSWSPAAELKAEFELLQRSTVDGVITTNYDPLLSIAFPTFQTFVGQEGLLFSDTQGIAEIYAIHGSSEEPESLVLTQEDYDDFDSRNAYLAAKLLTIFVEHPVVFLGYSFNDKNVHAMLISLVRGLKDKAVEKLQDRLIFVEWQEGADPTIERASVKVDEHVLPVYRLTVPDWTDVFGTLGERDRAMPARTLRVLKEQVYEIVKSNAPKDRLYVVSDIDSEAAEDISIVFGVGARVATVGIVGLSRDEIFADVLSNPPGNLPTADVIGMLLPKVPRRTWYPVFKYLREAELLDSKGSVKASAGVPPQVAKRVEHVFADVTLSARGRRRIPFADLVEAHDDTWVCTNALALPAYTWDTDGLRAYLIEKSSLADTNAWWAAQYAKLVVVYDFLKFGLLK